MTRRYCFTLDLKDDAKLIAEYKRCHEKIWLEITQSIRDSGIQDLEIYLFGTRMVVVMEVNEHRTRQHLALEKDAPEPRPIQGPDLGRVVAMPEVGGLHHRYERRAA